MEFIAKENSLAVRRMEENERDISLMLRWMTDPETMRVTGEGHDGALYPRARTA